MQCGEVPGNGMLGRSGAQPSTARFEFQVAYYRLERPSESAGRALLMLRLRLMGWMPLPGDGRWALGAAQDKANANKGAASKFHVDARPPSRPPSKWMNWTSHSVTRLIDGRNPSFPT